MAEGWYFIDPLGTSLQLDAPSLNRFLRSIGGIGMPPVDNLDTTGPQQDGATFQDFRLRPRVVPIVLSVKTASLAALFTDHQTWLNAMKPYAVASILRREMADGGQYELDVRIKSGMTMDTKDMASPTLQKYGVQFVAYDPVWRKLPIQTQLFSLPDLTQLTFPITFPIEFGGSTIDETTIFGVAGTWKTYPTITLTGPLTNPKVTNSSTSQLVQLNYTVPAGRVVTIDLTPGVKTVEDDLGVNLIGYISTDSDLFGFHLGVSPEVAGGSNSIRIQTSGATVDSEINMSWFSRYIGI